MKEWLLEKKYFVAAALAAALALVYFLQKEPAQPVGSTNALPAVAAEAGGTEGKEDKKEDKKAPGLILVDVKGEVKKPGVYKAEQDERVINMIERAGGLTSKADSSQVNFAQRLEDEMVVYIPAKGEQVQKGQQGASMSMDEAGKININKADAAKLEEIPGIGPAKAAAIIEYREKNGPFKEPEDLKQITGIGDKTYEKLESSITVR